jgi:hypothetical protein
LGATQNGQNRYNDQLQFEMTAALEKRSNWLLINIKPLDKVKEATLTLKKKQL